MSTPMSYGETCEQWGYISWGYTPWGPMRWPAEMEKPVYSGGTMLTFFELEAMQNGQLRSQHFVTGVIPPLLGTHVT